MTHLDSPYQKQYRPKYDLEQVHTFFVGQFRIIVCAKNNCNQVMRVQFFKTRGDRRNICVRHCSSRLCSWGKVRATPLIVVASLFLITDPVIHYRRNDSRLNKINCREHSLSNCVCILREQCIYWNMKNILVNFEKISIDKNLKMNNLGIKI